MSLHYNNIMKSKHCIRHYIIITFKIRFHDYLLNPILMYKSFDKLLMMLMV